MSLFWLTTFVLAGGIVAALVWYAAPYWFPNSESGVEGHTTEIFRAAAVVAGLLVTVAFAPVWYRPAQPLAPIGLPAFILALTAVVGGFALLLTYPRDLTDAGQAYVVAIVAGVASVLTASVKWAFDTVGSNSEHARDQRKRMAGRVEEMTNAHYVPMMRCALEAERALRDLEGIEQFPEPAPLAAEHLAWNVRASYALIVFLARERLLRREYGTVYLAEQRRERTVERLLEIFHDLLAIDADTSDDLVEAVWMTGSHDAATDQTSDGRLDTQPLPLAEFAVAANTDDSLGRSIRLLRHRIAHKRVATGLLRVLAEFQDELRGGINQIYRHWYPDWTPFVTTSEQRGEQRRVHIEWTRMLFYLRKLYTALDGYPSDACGSLDELIGRVGSSMESHDPVAVYSLYEHDVEELVSELVMRFRRSRPEIHAVGRELLRLLGSLGPTRDRFALEDLE